MFLVKSDPGPLETSGFGPERSARGGEADIQFVMSVKYEGAMMCLSDKPNSTHSLKCKSITLWVFLKKFRPKSGKKLFKPGQSGNPLGKPRGTLNKTTTLLKDAILEAASLAGGSNDREGLINYLKQASVEAPGPFLSLLGKVLPLQVAGDSEDSQVVFNIIYEAERGTDYKPE
jgi:Family of unknown function (DUF5681)